MRYASAMRALGGGCAGRGHSAIRERRALRVEMDDEERVRLRYEAQERVLAGDVEGFMRIVRTPEVEMTASCVVEGCVMEPARWQESLGAYLGEVRGLERELRLWVYTVMEVERDRRLWGTGEGVWRVLEFVRERLGAAGARWEDWLIEAYRMNAGQTLRWVALQHPDRAVVVLSWRMQRDEVEGVLLREVADAASLAAVEEAVRQLVERALPVGRENQWMMRAEVEAKRWRVEAKTRRLVRQLEEAALEKRRPRAVAAGLGGMAGAGGGSALFGIPAETRDAILRLTMSR